MLEINEIFGPTIQGEGKFIGTPSIFIRLSRCNMKCEGFNVTYKTPSGQIKKSCDTYYAVDPAFKNQWEKNSANEVINQVSKLMPDYKTDIVISGGEPLLYWKDVEFQKLLKYYIKNNHRVTIETNASLDINFNENYQKELVFSMSVKLSNSFESLKKRVNISTLEKILQNTKESYFKFVINKNTIKETKEEIEDILLKLKNIKDLPKAEVFLMPMGETNEEINKNSQSTIDMAIKNGFKYSDRLHIRIWDNKRGV